MYKTETYIAISNSIKDEGAFNAASANTKDTLRRELINSHHKRSFFGYRYSAFLLLICVLSLPVAAEPTRKVPDCTSTDLVRLEADYILACQFVQTGDPAFGAINNVFGMPTWVVPRENALAVLGLERAAFCLQEPEYRQRAQDTLDYLARVQLGDGSWYDQYEYVDGAVLSKSPTQATEVMIALNGLGFRQSRYNTMIGAAEWLLTLQDPANKTGQDDGLICGGQNASGGYETWRWTSDNAFAYQALRAAARWARIKRDRTLVHRYEEAAARILDGINTVLKDPDSPVWYVAVDANGNPTIPYHSWINYAPEMLDVPTDNARNPAIGEWIYETLVDPNTGAAMWNDDPSDPDGNRLSPGYSFQACLVWLDEGQQAYCDRAWSWAESSGLHQETPDSNGVAGGWIDWLDPDGGQAPYWERFIDTSFYAIVTASGGFDFSPSILRQ